MECLIYNYTKDKIIPETKIRKIIKTVLLKFRVDGEVSVSMVGEKKMRELNRVYSNKDGLTDVLSFSAREGYVGKSDCELGDIVICVPQIGRQAKENGVSVEQELSLMLIHGLLHLLGFDHKRSEERRKMFNLQEEILRSL
jgi:probable rRNA maturation factor